MIVYRPRRVKGAFISLVVVLMIVGSGLALANAIRSQLPRDRPASRELFQLFNGLVKARASGTTGSMGGSAYSFHDDQQLRLEGVDPARADEAFAVVKTRIERDWSTTLQSEGFELKPLANTPPHLAGGLYERLGYRVTVRAVRVSTEEPTTAILHVQIVGDRTETGLFANQAYTFLWILFLIAFFGYLVIFLAAWQATWSETVGQRHEALGLLVLALQGFVFGLGSCSALFVARVGMGHALALNEGGIYATYAVIVPGAWLLGSLLLMLKWRRHGSPHGTDPQHWSPPMWFRLGAPTLAGLGTGLYVGLLRTSFLTQGVFWPAVLGYFLVVPLVLVGVRLSTLSVRRALLSLVLFTVSLELGSQGGARFMGEYFSGLSDVNAAILALSGIGYLAFKRSGRWLVVESPEKTPPG